MANSIIKNRAKESGIKLWQVADKLGMTDGSFSRILRHELPEEKQNYILQLIEEIKEENAA